MSILGESLYRYQHSAEILKVVVGYTLFVAELREGAMGEYNIRHTCCFQVRSTITGEEHMTATFLEGPHHEPF